MLNFQKLEMSIKYIQQIFPRMFSLKFFDMKIRKSVESAKLLGWSL